MSALEPPAGLIFDLDGTLLALARRPGQLRRFWVATETPVNYTMLVLERLGLSEPLRFALDGARRMKGVATRESGRPIDGACELVCELASRMPLALVTNRGRSDALAFLSSTGLGAHLRAVVTRGDVWRLKPHPESVRLAARALGLAPERTWMVGDMPVDMRAARRAGSHAIGVRSGFCSEQELREAGAEVVLGSVVELRGQLD